jgi:hypothetical protein
MRALEPDLLPRRHHIRRVSKDFEPRHRVVERRPMRESSRDAWGERGIEQPRHEVLHLSQAFDVPSRDRQHAEADAVGVRGVAP